MFLYNQTTGELFEDDKLLGKGYAGFGIGKNNPAQQHVRNVGPIPTGRYIIEPGFDHPKLGKLAIPLVPSPNNIMFGRSHFYCHGDNSTHTASHGCIIMPRAVRDRVNLVRGTLQVVPF